MYDPHPVVPWRDFSRVPDAGFALMQRSVDENITPGLSQDLQDAEALHKGTADLPPLLRRHRGRRGEGLVPVEAKRDLPRAGLHVGKQ